jgi:hypothetical protein
VIDSHSIQPAVWKEINMKIDQLRVSYLCWFIFYFN